MLLLRSSWSATSNDESFTRSCFSINRLWFAVCKNEERGIVKKKSWFDTDSQLWSLGVKGLDWLEKCLDFQSYLDFVGNIRRRWNFVAQNKKVEIAKAFTWIKIRMNGVSKMFWSVTEDDVRRNKALIHIIWFRLDSYDGSEGTIDIVYSCQQDLRANGGMNGTRLFFPMVW